MRPAVFFLVAVLLVGILASRAAGDFSALAPCDVMQLSPCASAFAGKASPTSACCVRLKSHGPNCLCRYKDDANLKRLVDTRHKRRVFTACKVPVPSC
ncbi:unnamed protein product [Miscanthus lutarioriparius]|uniref:Bifunctional inhibitor/plant lipid transfer protein/seed storage helical domain-containing protein n=1 Tax=Miscanthus lutarioriparius TaxID=422564 RepID=A0A811NUA8_9POAL|nr:unnamed protein product [Miscanthus lutarioriparius]